MPTNYLNLTDQEWEEMEKIISEEKE